MVADLLIKKSAHSLPLWHFLNILCKQDIFFDSVAAAALNKLTRLF